MSGCRVLLTLLGGVCTFAAVSATGQDRPQGVIKDETKVVAWTEPATRWQKASDIIGKTVESSRAESCGKIEDLIIDIPSGRAIYTIVHFEGRYAPVPSSALSLPSHAEKYVLNVAKDQLKTFSYEKDRWPDFSDRGWADQVHTHYKVTPYWAQSISSDMGYNPAWYRYTTHWQKATDLLGKEVENSQDEDLGKIEDLIIDPDRARTLFGILSHGGVLGMGDKLFAIPWSSLTTMSADHEDFILNVDKDRLKNASGFDKKNWPNFTDAKWTKELYTYYELRPYWQDFGDTNKRNP